MTSEAKGGSGAGGIILAFLGGAVAAATAAMLLAPRSGAETRQRIGEAFGRTEDQVRRARAATAAATAAAREAFTEAMREGH